MVNIDAYIHRKHGEPWTTPHPTMTEELAETYGIMVYQEQVSRVVHRLGGLELKRAFRLAKAISKKKTDMIEAERGPFIAGCRDNGVDRRTAEQIFEEILRFGGYAFNTAHSTGYALIAFQTADMKVYHPLEFMAALMTFEMADAAKINEYLEECRRMGIAVAAPDVNVSDNDFTVDRDGAKATIRFGLGAVKGIGEKAVEAVVRARRSGGSFRSLFDFCERVDSGAVNRAALEALIDCGAFDRTGAMRKSMINALDRAIDIGAAASRDRRIGQLSFFGPADASAHADGADPPLPPEEWTESELLAREKAALGFYITRHPLTCDSELLAACATTCTTDLVNYDDGAQVVLGGMVTKLRTVITKGGRRAGAKLGIVSFEDEKGQIEAVVFPDDLEKYRRVLVPDAVVFLAGSVDRRREEPSLRVSRVVPRDDAVREFAEMVVLTIARPGADPSLLDRLLDLCRRHRGRCPVYV
jgi:DNA polymerase-3 subunit alpha